MADWCCYNTLLWFKSILSQHAGTLMYRISFQMLHRKPNFRNSFLVPGGPPFPWDSVMVVHGIQNLSHVSDSSRAAGCSCGPRHQVRPWGQGRDKARTRLGLPGSVLPVAKQDLLWGAGDWLCCSISVARTVGLWGLTWTPRPWAGAGSLGRWEDGAGTVRPLVPSGWW